MFRDRADAGRKLGVALKKYKEKGVVVLAIPRGGVPVGYEIAKALGCKLELIIARKLPFPYEPEAGFGAVAETGDVVLKKELLAYADLTKRDIENIKQQQLQEIRERIKKLRQGKELDIKGKTVIIVDDGLAAGSTMEAAIIAAKKKGAAKIIVAVPTASISVLQDVKKKADEVVCLDERRFFRAVADAYEEWHDLSDEEVMEIMARTK